MDPKKTTAKKLFFIFPLRPKKRKSCCKQCNVKGGEQTLVYLFFSELKALEGGEIPFRVVYIGGTSIYVYTQTDNVRAIN